MKTPVSWNVEDAQVIFTKWLLCTFQGHACDVFLKSFLNLPKEIFDAKGF